MTTGTAEANETYGDQAETFNLDSSTVEELEAYIVELDLNHKKRVKYLRALLKAKKENS